MQIKDKYELKTIFDRSSYNFGKRLSIDWIHSLVYFNEDKKINVFNMTDTRYGFVVIKEEDFIEDLSVNPLDSDIFYSTWNQSLQNGKIIKSSQDGSNRIVLKNVGYPEVLTIDVNSKRIFWLDIILKTFSSINFDGVDFETFVSPKMTSFSNSFLEIFGEDIYWSNANDQSIKEVIVKAKHGLNSTQIDHLIELKDSRIGSFKIIDSSLQPNSTNRCINSNCSQLCIPIGFNKYRCVCPQFKPQNDTIICVESVSIYFYNKQFLTNS